MIMNTKNNNVGGGGGDVEDEIFLSNEEKAQR
jgi:hypothetical protein